MKIDTGFVYALTSGGPFENCTIENSFERIAFSAAKAGLKIAKL